jgi:DNA-nicking Smr family endonuclease
MTDDDIDLYNPFPEPLELEITDSIDLHSFSPKETKAVVEAYLVEAHKKGLRQIRIIHGVGIGVQREMVRKLLSESPLVKSFSYAGWRWATPGATVATLID